MAKRKGLPAQVSETRSGKKLPNQSGDITPDQMSPLWSFSLLDIGSTWCWSKMSPEQFGEVFAKLKNFETMKWAEIKGPKKSHFIKKTRLIKEAQDRLSEIGFEEEEELFSLRLEGKQRIWGLLDDHVLRILWWDPEHEICPSNLKHT